ncbi:DUF305 domain-containing protein [Streptacidiphilus sp. ASG 303]|uniref:DUF305 domain-containing protein n=1 Tax=Streptacidiphilus sp. ASG 303 TaxID=2896847 RepID=UPI001E5AF784|nr:DUF305 domain-containing protein [Streptacidiphilus sp. ASG 303]MCD0484186.1 DUF305 domain-containing protein [Streptacidiphilus sp. ASG 303]
MSSSTLARRAAVSAAAVAAAVVLAACGGNGGSASDAHTGHGSGAPSPAAPSAPASATGAHNAADTVFAQQMIPHHRQALAMAGLAAARASSPQVKQLAAAIEKAQGPEIATMTGWLAAWGEQVPDAMAGMGSMPGTDHSAMPGTEDTAGMPGMADDADMARLGTLTGRAFDTAFLRMMIAHHAGAVRMAGDEQAGGAYAPARRLAASVATSQTAEITRMKQLLARG